MEKYRIQNIEQLTPELILSLINRFKLKEVLRLKRLKRYYDGQTDVKQRVTSEGKPNHKIATPFANYISTSMTSYLIGIPVSYKSTDENMMLSMQQVFDSNNEQSHNAQLALLQSIYGIGYELIYVNEVGAVNLNVLNPNETFIIYDTSINANPLAAIRFYEIEDYTTNESQLFVEVYTKDSIKYFKQKDDELVLVNETTHYFKDVPVIAYQNNDDEFGDFERVMDLIDAFDLTISDTQNSLAYFADAYLMISNMQVEAEDIVKMKENRVIVAGENGDAKFITQDGQLGLSDYQNKLQQNIHTFSFVPNMSEENFGNSGEALKYKLLGMENATAIKEREFKHGLEQRIKLIVNFLNLKGQSFDATDITMVFTRNMPTNLTSITDTVTKLKGMLSDQTLLSQLPFVEDVQHELELIKQQNQDTLNSYGTYDLTKLQQNNN